MTHKNGSIEEARFWRPFGVHLEPSGDSLLISEQTGRRVRRLNFKTDRVTTVMSLGNDANVDGLALEASVELPWKAVADYAGNIFVTTEQYIVRMYDAKTGTIDWLTRYHQASNPMFVCLQATLPPSLH